MKAIRYTLFFLGIILISIITFIVVIFLEINKILGSIFNFFRKIITRKK